MNMLLKNGRSPNFQDNDNQNRNIEKQPLVKLPFCKRNSFDKLGLRVVH